MVTFVVYSLNRMCTCTCYDVLYMYMFYIPQQHINVFFLVLSTHVNVSTASTCKCTLYGVYNIMMAKNYNGIN